jgi:DNA-binding GntR family transcriptional regulator
MADPEGSDEQSERLTEIAASFRTSLQTIEEITVHFVREAILRGVYRPGQRLQQDSIAELLGVSRMPVRAALRKLETEGLVVFNAHRGATVRTLSAEEIAEIYELRILLETHLLELAAGRVTPEILAELEAAADRVRHELDTSRRIEERQVLYTRLYALAERPRTSALVTELRMEVRPYLVLRQVAESPDTHLRVLEYLQRNDLEGAKGWLGDALGTMSKDLQRMVREEEQAEDGHARMARARSARTRA